MLPIALLALALCAAAAFVYCSSARGRRTRHRADRHAMYRAELQSRHTFGRMVADSRSPYRGHR